jgi:hypothetical protein
MSTKTTFKRIALVAVASLGFGVLSSVAPASATNEANSVVTAIGVTALSSPPRVGVAQTTTFSIVNTAGTAGTVEFAAIITAKPATSLLNDYTGAAFTNAGEALAGTATGAATDGDTATARGPKYIVTASTLTANLSTAPGIAGSLTFTPDVPGVYKITVFSDSAGTGNLVAGAKSATWTVTAAGAPATATISTFNATAAACTSGFSNATDCLGSLIKVSLKDANGYATAPRGGELVSVTSNSASTSPAMAAPVTLSSSNVDLSGNYFGNWTSATALTAVIATTPGGALSAVSGLVASTSVTYKALTAVATSMAIADTTGVTNSLTDVTAGGKLGGSWAAGVYTAAGSNNLAVAVSSTKASITYLVKSAAATVVGLTVFDANGNLTGANGVTGGFGYTIPVTTAANGVTVTSASTTAWAFSGSATVTGVPVAGDVYQVIALTAADTSDYSALITSGVSVVSASTSTLTPATSVAVVGGQVLLTLTAKDANSNKLANASVTFSTGLTSRNGSRTLTTTTDASGVATYAFTDASTSTTTLTDTVAATISYAGTTVSATSAVITWKSSLGVSTVKMTSDDYTVAGTANSKVTLKPISVAKAGAAGGAVTVTAVVADVNGAVLVGAPVTFTVAGTGVAIPSTKVTAYTDATGTASSSVYAWIAGTYTVTATAGGVTGTATASFNSVAGNERIISATSVGNVVTGKAVDRFGNPVLGVKLYATVTSGNGYFGNSGLKTASTDTLADGTATFVVTGDASSVKISNIDPAAVAGTTIGQTSAAKGYDISGATAALFTATTVGTTTTAETGVGASFDAAGVSSATAEVTADTASAQSQAAADAAAEATDAANAATDAANAAAEAADAATAAAQDAADAVAALSTQVSEMVDALKKQITALTNLVIKIQKKVKA